MGTGNGLRFFLLSHPHNLVASRSLSPVPDSRLSTPIDPARIRRPPRTGFGWIDRRFVNRGFSASLSAEAKLLYFFLSAVADANGLSYFGDRAIADRLAITPDEVERARRELILRGLVLFHAPLYQLLPLPATPPCAPRPAPRGGPVTHVASVVDEVLRTVSPHGDRERSLDERDPRTLD